MKKCHSILPLVHKSYRPSKPMDIGGKLIIQTVLPHCMKKRRQFDYYFDKIAPL